ncbi:expressed unknown protein [Seminavis robusta]|uniref:Uncharacterized protein n=1 Tax=Seminavis robusta TaxID=568900 RepID=A0A9N8DTZ8_9STRA|nr:expressed unknown protein [Seminavis robusta]|eukprot:Sro277_g106320.1 n/a (168) ;mRNA; r:45076-45579
MTVLVFAITLIRLPMHMAKTFYVAATTEECYERCQFFDPFLRILVFLLVPIPHLLWLLGTTLFAATVGNLYYISRTTRTIFKHQYAKACGYGTKTVMLDEDSHIGVYIQSCRDFMADDGPSLGMVEMLKAICSFLPGLPLGALPFIPFTLLSYSLHSFGCPSTFSNP